MKTNFKKGFTLIELLVVIAIIGILSAVVLASLNTARDKAQDASIQATLAGLRTTAELQYSDLGNQYAGSDTVYTGADNSTNGCEGKSDAGTILANANIQSAITEAALQSNGTTRPGVVCVITANTYVIAVEKVEQDGAGDGDFWCIDSTGVATEIDLDAQGTDTVAAGTDSCSALDGLS